MKKIAVVFLLLILTCIMRPAYASDGLFMDSKDIVDSQLTPSYEKYDFGKYKFDYKVDDVSVFNMGGVVNNVVSAIFNGLASMIFMFIVLVCKVCVFLFTSCYKVSIFDLFPDVINKITLSIKSSFFDLFLNIIVTFAGIYGLYKHLKGKQTATVEVFGTLIVALLIANIYFSNPAMFGKTINNASEAICTSVLYGSAKASGAVNGDEQITSNDDAVVLIGNHFWEMNVTKPYELIEYGSIGNHSPEEFLASDNEKRQELANEYAKTNSTFTIDGAIARLGLSLLMLLISLVNCILILVVSLIILFNQCGAIVYFSLAGVFLLFGMHPKNGIPFLVKWGWKCVGFEFKKVIITMLLSIYFATSLIIYSASQKYGLLFSIALNIVLLVFMILNHEKIYQMLSEPIMNMLSSNDSNLKRNMSGVVGKAIKGSVIYGGAQKLINSNMERYEKRNRKNFEYKNKGKAEELLNQKYNREKEGSRNTAQKQLLQKYNDEKLKAEERAKRTGNPPEYTKFVNEAMLNKKEGKPMFSERQIDEISQYSDFVKEVDGRKKQGLSPFSDERMSSTFQNLYKFKREGVDDKTLSLLVDSAMGELEANTRKVVPDLKSRLRRKQIAKRILSTDLVLATSYEKGKKYNVKTGNEKLDPVVKPEKTIKKSIEQDQTVKININKNIRKEQTENINTKIISKDKSENAITKISQPPISANIAKDETSTLMKPEKKISKIFKKLEEKS